MKILVTANLVPFIHGGATYHIDGVVSALRRAGHAVELLKLPFRFSPEADIVRAFNELRDIVAATQFAWDQLVPRVATARAALDELANEPRGLDAELAPELARLRPRLDELGRSLMALPRPHPAALNLEASQNL